MSSKKVVLSASLLNRLNLLIDETSKSQKEFAAKLAISPSHISKILKGESGISPQLNESIIRVYGVNRIWWETGEGEMFNPEIPSIADTDALEHLTQEKMKAAVTEYFMKAGVNPSLAEKVLEELGKLDEGSQFAEVGKIISDVADIMRKKEPKEKGQ